MTGSKTVQLRRYEIVEGELDSFAEWFTENLVPVRVQYGFTLEFAYLNRDANEFIWAVSYPGDKQAFADIEAVYNVSPERAAAFDGVPKRVEAAHVNLVDEA